MSWENRVGTGNRAPCLLDTYTGELVGQYQLMPLELDIYETRTEIYPLVWFLQHQKTFQISLNIWFSSLKINKYGDLIIDILLIKIDTDRHRHTHIHRL